MGFVLLVWLAFSIFVGIRAKARGRFGFGWFLISVVASPVLAALALFLLPDKKSSETEPSAPKGDRVECLKCGELIAANAKVCRFCGFEVLPGSDAKLAQQRSATRSMGETGSKTTPADPR